MTGPSVIVIGAGALGLASAWHLRERGLNDITVIEADYPASASSGLSVGFIQSQHIRDIDIEMRVLARRFFADMEEDHGLVIEHSGYLRLAFRESDLASYAHSVELQNQLGVMHPRVLDRTEVGHLVPDLNLDDVVGGLWGPDDGYIDGHLYCGALAAGLTSRGVKIVPRTRLQGAEKAGGRHRLDTTNGVFEADIVVNAAGAWADRIAAMFGTVIPVRPERHQAIMVRLSRPLGYVMPCVMTYSPGSGSDGIFARHESADQLVAGFHSLDPIGEIVDPDRYSGANDLEFLEKFAEQFQERFPTLEDAELGRGWAGIYPVSPDGLPFVGPHDEDPSVIAACSAGGAGIMLSPLVGRLVSDWIADGTSTAISAPRKLLPSRVGSSVI